MHVSRWHTFEAASKYKRRFDKWTMHDEIGTKLDFIMKISLNGKTYKYGGLVQLSMSQTMMSNARFCCKYLSPTVRDSSANIDFVVIPAAISNRFLCISVLSSMIRLSILKHSKSIKEYWNYNKSRLRANTLQFCQA